MSDGIPITVPDLGESIVEVTVASWLVQEGEAVSLDQALLEVTSDKSDVEIPAPESGVLLKKEVQEGEKVSKGAVLGWISQTAEVTASHEKPAPQVSTPLEEPQAHRVPQDPPKTQPLPLSTPLAQKIASQKGIPLENVQGSGYRGRIFSRDLQTSSLPSTSVKTSAALSGVEPTVELQFSLFSRRLEPGKLLEALQKTLQSLEMPLRSVNFLFWPQTGSCVAPRILTEDFYDTLEWRHKLADLELRARDGRLTEEELQGGDGLICLPEPSLLETLKLPLEGELQFTLSLLPSRLRKKEGVYTCTLRARTEWFPAGFWMELPQRLQNHL